jgi:hypothetical protein
LAAFIKAMTHANQAEDRGSIKGLHPAVVAEVCGATVDEIRRLWQAFRELGMLLGERIANWVKRQVVEKPRSAVAERVAKHRRKKADDSRQMDLGLPPVLAEQTSAIAEPGKRASAKSPKEKLSHKRAQTAKRVGEWRDRRRAAGLPINTQIETRRRIWERDGYECQYCGTKEGPFHCDHKMPRSRGGADNDGNLITSCGPCNISKGRFTIDEWCAAGLAPPALCVRLGISVTDVTFGVSGTPATLLQAIEKATISIPLLESESDLRKEEKEVPPLAPPRGGGEQDYLDNVVAIRPVKDEADERPARRQRERGATGSRLPADWEPDDRGVAFARDLGLDVADTLREFRNYWISQPGRHGIRIEWWRVWENSCSRAATRRSFGSSYSGGSGSKRGGVLSALRLAQSYGMPA